MSSMESIAVNEQLTMEDQIERKKVLEQLQEIEKAGPSTKATPKGRAALLTGLNTLAGEALKGSKTAVHSDATGSTDGATDTADVDGTDDSDDTSGGFGSSKGDSGGGDSSSDDYYIPDPLTASIMAGVVGLVSKSELSKQTALMQERLSKVATLTAKNGADWMQNFYKYGQIASQGTSMGSYDKGTAHIAGDTSTVKFKIKGSEYWMSIDGGKTYKDLGHVLCKKCCGPVTIPDNDVIQACFPGYTFGDSDSAIATAAQDAFGTGPCSAHAGSMGAGDDVAFDVTITNNNSYSGGGSGLAASASGDLQTLMNQWSYVQQTVNSYNQTIQTTSNLPAAMQQNTTSSINNADQSRQSIQSALDSTANLVCGWSNT